MQRLLLSVCALLVVSFLPLSAVVVTIGTGTSTNDSITYPAPYGNWYTMARHQILVRASEIIAAGGSAGSIASLAFNVAATNNTQALQNFTIKLKQTSATSLSSSFDNTGWTTVYSVSSYTVTTGWNTHTFSTPFAWDGSSNLLIDICFYQGSCYNWTYNASTYYTTTAFTSVVYYRDDCDFGVCSTSSVTGTSSNRPNLRLDIQAGMPNDAGIAGIVAPVAPFSPGSQTVEVLLKNYGNNTISSVTINWSVNGTPQTPYNWTGSLAPGATASGNHWLVQLRSEDALHLRCGDEQSQWDYRPELCKRQLYWAIGSGTGGYVYRGRKHAGFCLAAGSGAVPPYRWGAGYGTLPHP
jgi:hypothetical protein